MNDPKLNSVLKWAIENSDASRNDPSAGHDPAAASNPSKGLDPELLASLMGGPSDADLMMESMAAIHSPEVDLENKMVAWDNFEQLIENLDNANNMANLGLWQPLVQKLEDEEAEVRRMALWCIATAVQNNIKSQESLLAVGATPKMVDLAVNDPHQATRKKAVMALSSQVRNYQPGLDEALKHIPEQFKTSDKVDAGDMDAVDEVIHKMREHATKSS
ncbi:hsp70 nucleotide exchange factor fes1 [Zalaria obscura]|uniref:Hsp70 nucleotide exchange factor fes1 n=1 Tax=Zalaria obscura TaxID=2024903 RepID=A0ACC3S796_9PEZI